MKSFYQSPNAAIPTQEGKIDALKQGIPGQNTLENGDNTNRPGLGVMFVLYTQTTTCHGLGYLFQQDANQSHHAILFPIQHHLP